MDGTGTTGDTGGCLEDTGVPSVSLGSGCGGGSAVAEQATASAAACDRDEETTAVAGTSVGGGCGCAAGPVSAGSFGWLVLAYIALRRWAPLGVLLLWTGLAHAQVDTQRRVVDGGDWLLLQEPEIGTPWTGSGTLSINHAREASRVVGGPWRGPKLQRVTTQQLDVSLLFSSFARVGLALPNHTRIAVADTVEGRRWGDTSVWLAVPLTEADKQEGVTGTWAVRVDVPTGAPELWLGDPGAVQATVAVGVPLGPVRLAGNLGARFQPMVALPGVFWGNSLQWGFGARIEPWGPLFVAAEAAGRTPVKFYAGQPQDYASELVGLLGVRPTRMVSVSAGAGGGTAQGLSSPALRVLGAFDLRPRTLADRDADGLADLRDVCPSQPEDRDGFRDQDGCPDLDNDQDGIADLVDDCPVVAENINGVEDFDGCPDLATQVSVVVQTEAEADVVTVTIGARSVRAFPGEPVEQLVRELEVEVTAHAPRHGPVTKTVQLAGRDALTVELLLPASDYGWLEVVALAPDGGSVEADVAVDGVAIEGEVELPAGQASLRVVADGYLPVELVVAVPANERLRLPLTLQPSGVRVAGDRLEVGERTAFGVNDAEVAEQDPALTEMLAWLRAHREVELLRVEGHADGQGSSRYNYHLSLRRAEAVRAWLIQRGIDEDRLQATGTGEARAEGEEVEADRRVGFLVLVWREEALGATR